MIYHDYSYDQLEAFADELNKRYNPKRLIAAEQVDVFDIVDMLGARLAFDYLTPDRSCLGATTFKDGSLWIWPGDPYTKGMLPEKKFYRARTIIIDTDLDSSKTEQDRFIENHTVMHECFHFDKHQASFKHNGAHLTKAGALNYSQQTYDRKSAIYKIERQADYAAAAFLMPRQAVKNTFYEIFHARPGDPPSPFGYSTKPKIKEMGRLFGVNQTPMEFRLKDLGLLSKRFNSSL